MCFTVFIVIMCTSVVRLGLGSNQLSHMPSDLLGSQFTLNLGSNPPSHFVGWGLNPIIKCLVGQGFESFVAKLTALVLLLHKI